MTRHKPLWSLLWLDVLWQRFGPDTARNLAATEGAPPTPAVGPRLERLLGFYILSRVWMLTRPREQDARTPGRWGRYICWFDRWVRGFTAL